MKKSTPLLIAALLLLSVGADASNCVADDRLQSQQFFNNFCITCHRQDKQEGDIRLDQIDDAQWRNPTLLDRIYTALESKVMPPEDAKKHPTDDESNALRKVLGVRLTALAEKQKPGMLKRLSRVEYQNTVNDVFGTTFSLIDQLPLDNIDAGFDNNADHLHMSVVDMETYFKLAHRIAHSVVSDKPEPRVAVYSTKNTDIDPHSTRDSTKGFAPSLQRESRPLVFASPLIKIKINPSIKRSGVYRIVPKGFYIKAQFVPGNRRTETLPGITNVSDVDPADTPPSGDSLQYVIMSDIGYGKSIGGIPKTAEWKEFDPREGFVAQLAPNDTIILKSHTVKSSPTPKKNAKGASPPEGQPLQRMFCIEEATITGPVYDAWPPRTYFYDTYCKDIDKSADYPACHEILKRLAQKLFRRPVSDAEMRQTYVLAKNEFAQGRSIYSALQAGIRGMLCSPQFLYKQEGVSEYLDSHAIAARMSYFLWNSVPDETLFELAREGKLKDPNVRRQQTQRMLQDVKADRFVTDYVYQWLNLEKLKIVEPDMEIFSVDEFDLVRDQIKEEPIAFFKEVLASNLSVSNFIDSDFVMITPELNYIYQIEGHPVAEPGKRLGGGKLAPKDYGPKKITSKFSKVMLGDGYGFRGGLLTQAGFMLMTTNNGEYTNPFYRGAWVLRSFYGDRLETPDDLDITALSPPTKTTTIKQTIDAHRENASCNICHKKMDPFGIALENIDVIGRWRDQYTEFNNYAAPKQKIKEKDRARFPVEANTVHMDGRTFEGPQGLKQILLEDKDKFARTFVENMLSYAMARQLTFRDRKSIEELCNRSAKDDYRLRDMMLTIVSSDNFVKR